MAQLTAGNESEAAIFDAAIQVFARKGKDGARMQEIADLAGINKAMLHYYFRSKDRLYEAVFEHVLSHFFGAMGNVFQKDQPFFPMLKELIDVYMNEHQEHPEVSRLWVHEQLGGATVSKEIHLRSGKSGQGPAAFVRKIQDAIDKKEIRPVDPIQVLMSFLGLTIFYFVACPTFSAVNPAMVSHPEQALTERKKHIYDLLYHGLSN